MSKLALLALLCVCTGISTAAAQTATTAAPTAVHRALETEGSLAASALTVLPGAVAILRGRCKP